MALVAPASRRLLALSWNSNTAGKMPALPQHAATLIGNNSQLLRRQLEAPGAALKPLFRACDPNAVRTNPSPQPGIMHGRVQSENLTLASQGYGTRLVTVAFKTTMCKFEQFFHLLRATKDALCTEVYSQT